MDRAEPVIALQGVAKTFGELVALEGFDLAVQPGQFVTLLGPSGCGKSTALRIVAGLSEPSRGRVVRPQPQSGVPDVGFVFQEPTLMPWATVAANVALPLTLRRLPAAEIASRVEAMLARVGLSDFARAYPRQLSGGMQMRVSIARALVTAPALLLMDEPFAALDEITRFRLNDDLLALWQALGQTVVFVTHSVFESVYLSQRVLVMRARPGRIVAEIAIDAPLPRGELFRTSADYAALCRRVSQALHAASDAGAPA